jgi:hypothetical protein
MNLKFSLRVRYMFRKLINKAKRLFVNDPLEDEEPREKIPISKNIEEIETVDVRNSE